MPDYVFESPDGLSLRLTSETVPTQEALDTGFAQLRQQRIDQMAQQYGEIRPRTPEMAVTGVAKDVLASLFSPIYETEGHQQLRTSGGWGEDPQRQGVYAQLGQMLGDAGQVAKAYLRDVGENLQGYFNDPEHPYRNVSAAVDQFHSTAPYLPSDELRQLAQEEANDRGEFPWATMLWDISSGLAETAPKIAAMHLAGPGLAGQTTAGAGLFGVDNQGEFSWRGALSGALLPVFGLLGRMGASKLLNKAIDAGAVQLENRPLQKVVEQLGEQAALNAVMTVERSPELLQLWKSDRNQFWSNVGNIVGTNLAFGLAGLRNYRSEQPSLTETRGSPLAQVARSFAVNQPLKDVDTRFQEALSRTPPLAPEAAVYEQAQAQRDQADELENLGGGTNRRLAAGLRQRADQLTVQAQRLGQERKLRLLQEFQSWGELGENPSHIQSAGEGASLPERWNVTLPLAGQLAQQRGQRSLRLLQNERPSTAPSPTEAAVQRRRRLLAPLVEELQERQEADNAQATDERSLAEQMEQLRQQSLNRQARRQEEDNLQDRQAQQLAAQAEAQRQQRLAYRNAQAAAQGQAQEQELAGELEAARQRSENRQKVRTALEQEAQIPNEPVNPVDLRYIAQDVLGRMPETNPEKRILSQIIKLQDWGNVARLLHLTLDPSVTQLPPRYRFLQARVDALQKADAAARQAATLTQAKGQPVVLPPAEPPAQDLTVGERPDLVGRVKRGSQLPSDLRRNAQSVTSQGPGEEPEPGLILPVTRNVRPQPDKEVSDNGQVQTQGRQKGKVKPDRKIKPAEPPPSDQPGPGVKNPAPKPKGGNGAVQKRKATRVSKAQPASGLPTVEGRVRRKPKGKGGTLGNGQGTQPQGKAKTQTAQSAPVVAPAPAKGQYNTAPNSASVAERKAALAVLRKAGVNTVPVGISQQEAKDIAGGKYTAKQLGKFKQAQSFGSGNVDDGFHSGIWRYPKPDAVDYVPEELVDRGRTECGKLDEEIEAKIGWSAMEAYIKDGLLDALAQDTKLRDLAKQLGSEPPEKELDRALFSVINGKVKPVRNAVEATDYLRQHYPDTFEVAQSLYGQSADEREAAYLMGELIDAGYDGEAAENAVQGVDWDLQRSQVYELNPALGYAIDRLLHHEGPSRVAWRLESGGELQEQYYASKLRSHNGLYVLPQEAAEQVSQKALGQFYPFLQRLGARVLEDTHLDRPAVTSMGDKGDITLAYNPYFLRELEQTNPGFTTALLREELVHTAAYKVLAAHWEREGRKGSQVEYILNYYAQLGKSLPQATRVAVRQAYGAHGDAELGAEYLRGLIQQARYGRITEEYAQGLTAKVKAFLHEIVTFLKELATGQKDSQLQRTIDEINALLDLAEGKRKPDYKDFNPEEQDDYIAPERWWQAVTDPTYTVRGKELYDESMRWFDSRYQAENRQLIQDALMEDPAFAEEAGGADSAAARNVENLLITATQNGLDSLHPQNRKTVEYVIEHHPELEERVRDLESTTTEQRMERMALHKLVEEGLDLKDAQDALADWSLHRQEVWDRNPALAVWIELNVLDYPTPESDPLRYYGHELAQWDSKVAGWNKGQEGTASASEERERQERVIYEAGETQRGEPESVMLQSQRQIREAGGPAILIDLIEHIGDLAHRASRKNAIVNVAEKVRKGLRAVMPPKGYMDLAQEMEHGYRENAIYRAIQENPRWAKEYAERPRPLWQLWQEAGKDPSIPQRIAQAKAQTQVALKDYVAAHELYNQPVTRLGHLGKEAALALGRGDYTRLKGTLLEMQDWLNDYERLDGEEARHAKFTEGLEDGVSAGASKHFRRKEQVQEFAGRTPTAEERETMERLGVNSERIGGRQGLEPEQRDTMERLAAAQAGAFERQPVTAQTTPEGATLYVPSNDPASRILAIVKTNPGNDRRHGWARSLLQPIADLLEVSPDPIDWRTVSDPAERITAAHLVAGQHFAIQKQQAKIDGRIATAQATLDAVSRQYLRVPALQLGSDMLRAVVRELQGRYNAYLENLRANAPAGSNLAAAVHAALNRATLQTGDWVVAPGTVERAIEELAENPAIQTHQQINTTQQVLFGTEQIVAQARNLGGLRSTTPENSARLVGDAQGQGPDGLDPILLRVRDLGGVIDAYRRTRTETERVQEEIRAFEEYFGSRRAGGGTRAPSTRQVLNRYASLVMQAKTADRLLRSLSGQYDRARAMLLGAQDAQGLVHELVNQPAYKERVAAVAQALGLQLDGLVNTVGAEIRLKAPISGNDIILSRIPTAAQEDSNRAQVEQLLREIQELEGNDQADPVLKHSWHIIGERLGEQWLESIANPMRSGYDLIDFKVMFPFLRTQQGLFELIGGPQTLDLRRAFMAVDSIGDKLNLARMHPNYGFAAVAVRLEQAMQSHGLDPKNNHLAAKYERDILGPILATYQHWAAPRLKVGDFIPFTPYRVTAPDLALAKAQHQHEQAVRQYSEQDLKVYGAPSKILDELSGQKLRRSSVPTGPMMVTRIIYPWASAFVRGKWRRGISEQEQQVQVADLMGQIDHDPDLFRDFVLGYVRESNPAFERRSAFEREFQELTQLATRNQRVLLSVNDLSDAVAELRGELPDAFRPRFKEALANEIAGYVKRFTALVQSEDAPKDVDAIATLVYKSLRTEGSFLKPRGQMFAPSTFYQYGKVATADLAKVGGIAHNIARARAIDGMDQVRTAFMHLRDKLVDEEMRGVVGDQIRTTAESRAWHAEQRRRGEIRYTVTELNRRIYAINAEIQKANDTITHWDEEFSPSFVQTGMMLNRAVTLQLLGSVGAVMNNVWGGVFQNDLLLNAHIRGLKHALLSPLLMGETALETAITSSLRGMARLNPQLRGQVRQTLPLAGPLAQMMARHQQAIARLQEQGIITPYDWANRRAAKKGVGFGGEVPAVGAEPPTHLQVMKNVFTTPPLMLQEMIFPRVFDNAINIAQAVRTYGILLDLASYALPIAEARQRRGWTLDARDPRQAIVPEEMGLTVKGLQWLKTYVEPVMSLEHLLFSYAQQLQATPPARRGEVPLATEEQIAAMLRSFGQRGNIVRESNSPASGRGTWLRRVAFTLQSYPANLFDQVWKTVPVGRDPQRLISTLGFLAVAGMSAALAILLKESRRTVMTAYTGRLPGDPGLSNVAANPVSVDSVRYLAGALGGTVPYLNMATDRMFGGGGGRGSFLDLAEIVPFAGWVRDVGGMTREAALSGDVPKVALDYVNRYLPLYSGAVNRLPMASEYIQMGNTLRALRAATPLREIEMRPMDATGAGNPTALSRHLRRAEMAAYDEDMPGMRTALEEAVAWKVAHKPGLTPQQAAAQVHQSLVGRNPENRVYGRRLTEEERRTVLNRMNGGQQAAYEAGMRASQLLSGQGGTVVAGNRTGRGSRRQRQAFYQTGQLWRPAQRQRQLRQMPY